MIDINFIKEKSKYILKNVPLFTIVFIGLVASFLLLMTLSSLFPSSLIEKNVIESSETMLEEGNMYVLPFGPEFTIHNFADTVMINIAYSIDNEDPFFSFMSSRKNFKKGLTTETKTDTELESISIISGDVIVMHEKYNPTQELYDFVRDNVHISVEYARYWHGYLVFLRPLLIFFNLNQLRIFIMILLIVLLTWLIVLICKKLDWKVAFCFLFTLLFYDYIQLAFCLEYSPVFFVMMIACIVLMYNYKKIKNLYLFFFIVACICNFIDFLTVPLITLCFPLILYILLIQKEEKYDLKASLLLILKATIVWFIGYGLTWLSKWLLFDICYNRSLLFNAIGHVLYRTTRHNFMAPATLDKELLDFALPFIPLLLVIITAVLFSKEKKTEFLKEVLPFIVLSIFPIIWYVVCANHTTLHPFFVERHMIIPFFSILLMIKKKLF